MSGSNKWPVAAIPFIKYSMIDLPRRVDQPRKISRSRAKTALRTDAGPRNQERAKRMQRREKRSPTRRGRGSMTRAKPSGGAGGSADWPSAGAYASECFWSGLASPLRAQPSISYDMDMNYGVLRT